MKCCFKGCKNKVFENLDKCALHCSSEIILDEDKYLSEFDNFFMNYLLVKIKNLNGLRCENWHGILQELSLKDIGTVGFHQNEILKEILNTKVLYITNICFPKIKNRSLSKFRYVTDQFDRIIFENCFFGYDSVVSESHKYYYRECLFNDNLRIKASLVHLGKSIKEDEGRKSDTLLLYEEVYRYSRCTFSGDVSITNEYDYNASRNYNYIGFNVFENCVFRGDISIENIRINGVFINFSNKNNYNIDEHMLNFKDISILECDFYSDFRLNGFEKKEEIEDGNSDITDSIITPVKINKIFVKNTKFNKKFELKNSHISNINFNNSNVEKVFDVFESKFEKSYFYKSVFNDFSGFEKVVFGVEGKNTEEYQAKFIYTTFMSFSNFRSTIFLSGLDFENANLKEQPNFLKTKISPKNTNRETFRIIKNSFDDVGNKLEANKFFAEEMAVYKKELDDDGDKWDRLVYRANEEISDFGRSYIKPSVLLFLGLIIYTSLLSIHESFFENYDYFLHPWVNCLSIQANEVAKNLLPFSKFLEKKSGIEFVSLLFYIWFGILIWQIVVAVKRHTQR